MENKPTKKEKVVELSPLDKALVRIGKLELALSKVATLSGNGNHLREFDLEPWTPSKKEMNKNRG
jgi:hypothetical protein